MRKFLFPAIVGFSFLLGTALARYGQATKTPQTTEATTSQVLVQEIRALRQTLQDFTTGTSRLQVVIEHCRVQQFLVERLTDELNSIQSQIDNNQGLTQQLEEATKNLELSLATETDTLRRDEIERERKSISSNIELNKQRNQRFEERRIQVIKTLQTEKAKLNELRNNLDALERSFVHQKPEQNSR